MALYARRERTTDEATFAMLKVSGNQPVYPRMADVVLYGDRACTHPVARHPWHHSNKPQKRHRTVMHNCARYPLVWCADCL